MKCSKIRELILTDYADDRLDGERKADTERHFAGCRDCKELFAAVEKTVIEPFMETARIKPPESIWLRTRAAIIEEQNKPVFGAGLLSRVKQALYIPRPVMAAISAMVLIIAVVTMAQLKIVGKEKIVKTDVQEQTEYYSYFTESPVSTAVNDETGLGTAIEKYFL
jgi:anti-sigma factor RsiW